jgi:D-3-phosphoglycerate dehydrogenase
MSTGRWRVVAVNAPAEFDFSPHQEALDPLGVTIERVHAADEAAYAAVAADADVVIPMAIRTSRAVIERLARCRLIPSGGIGYDHIDVEAATEHGIMVTNMADTFTEDVANHTWLLLLMVARRGVWLHQMSVSGRWREAADQLFPVMRISIPRITGQTLGLIAFGGIARAVARRAQAFGMTCLAYDPYVPDEVFARAGVERASLAEVCRRADIISCHLPLTKETERAIGAEQFALMKPGAIFLNTGRGRVVDEAALIAALQAGRLYGAGLDVLEQEPPDPANPLLAMPNVVLTPHIGSASDVAYLERRRFMGRQIADVLRGRVPKGVVNPAVLDRWRGAAATTG